MFDNEQHKKADIWSQYPMPHHKEGRWVTLTSEYADICPVYCFMVRKKQVAIRAANVGPEDAGVREWIEASKLPESVQ